MPNASTDSDAPSVPPHNYLWDLVVFKVEERLFRVNKHAFVQHSSVFKNMFHIGDGRTGEGVSDDHPVVLNGYRAGDFEALLMILYPTAHDLISGNFSLTKEQWSGVLRLSRSWEMYEIRDFAIQTLSSSAFDLTPLDKVALGREHKVTSWLVDGLTSLAVEEMSPDALEEAVGLRTAFRIAVMQAKPRSLGLVNTVVVNGTKRTGVTLSALYCAYCLKPFMGELFNCQSCRRSLEYTTPGTAYIQAGMSGVMVESALGSCFYFNVQHIHCTSCAQRAITGNIACHSCSRSTSYTDNVYACHDPGASSAPTTKPSSLEALVREVFHDEIQECDPST
ncbi:hypothetical protein NMY22_g11397 [Coprinellus aureogranulatus]|nr:hypothetical protein NMY22_g11397 [Coprinellus aureogranulatus]